MASDGPAEDPPQPGMVRRIGADWLTWLETSRLYRLLRITEPIGILLAVLALTSDLQSRQEARIVSSWQLLTAPAPGNSGKIQALEYLNGESFWRDRVPLVGIDLSPPGEDQQGAFLEGIDLSGARLTGADFSKAKLSNANFGGADLRGAKFKNLGWTENVNFRASFLHAVDLSGGKFTRSDFRDLGAGSAPYAVTADASSFATSDFTGSSIRLSGSGTLFWESNVSNACLLWQRRDRPAGEPPEAPPAGKVWAIAGSPPRGIPEGVEYRVCAAAPPSIEIGGVSGFDYSSCFPDTAPVARISCP